MALASSAQAIILFGEDENANRREPSNGAPWHHVARLDNGVTSPASGVYLGDRFVLTADHVTTPVSVRINGVDYQLDSSFKPKQIAGVDLKLYRIARDPGLPKLKLLKPQETDRGKNCTIIGWGLGTGGSVPKQGWKWGDDTTRLARWGTNRTGNQYKTLSGRRFLKTAFNAKTSPNEAGLAGGDSGGALFVKIGGVWKLAGIAVDVQTMGRTFYDADLKSPGHQPELSYYIPIRLYAAAILMAMAE